MSKAFTSETPAWEAPPAVPTRERAITLDGYQALEAELADLLNRRRPPLLAAAADADEVAVAALRRLDRRVFVLQRTIALSRPLPPPAGKTEQVYFGAYVTVEADDGAQLTYRIVGPDQSDASKRWVNHEAPLGQALLRQPAGAVVTVSRPKGEATYTILKVSPVP